ncbi:DsbA family oxidoreductase [Chitiniphilus eburneus]|uniref:DsbA family oxidoreductase n=1 Tax=Chitiniphilus eburneus TaxID=2571148 RepID=A0A4U0Q8R3_9NEIS|nr:DsbA family oxidoreductase [Chitiniphilus eburneus]TJZ77585.1 DsbA family oxidoreductase [Chitiniphilus eburneus]
MSTSLKIDFVSDVSCPWCAIGLASLRRAAEQLGDEVALDLHFQPFELNPQMGPAGQGLMEHLGEKYGMGEEQLRQSHDNIRERGAALGFTFGPRERIYNTFDAHRLLHWAGEQGAARQLALKQALFTAYFTDGQDPSDHDTLVGIVQSVGLDGGAARAILDSDEHADAVRQQERFFQEQGISAVPAVIINDRYLIQGGQPPETFVQALRKIAADAAG